MKKIILFLKKLWYMFIGLFRKNKKTLDKVEYSEYTESFENKSRTGSLSGTSQNNANKFYFDKMIFLAIPMIILWALFDKEKKVKVYRNMPEQDVVIPNLEGNLKKLEIDKEEVLKNKEDLAKAKKLADDKKDNLSNNLSKNNLQSNLKQANSITNFNQVKRENIPFKVSRSLKPKVMIGPKDMLKVEPIKLGEALEIQKANDDDIVLQRNRLKKNRGLMAIDKLMAGVLTVPLIGILGISYIGKAFRQVKINNRLSMALGEVNDNSLKVRRINPFMFFSKKRTEKFTNKLQMSNLIGTQRLRTGIFKKYGSQNRTNSFKNVVNKIDNLEDNLKKDLYKNQKGKVKVLK